MNRLVPRKGFISPLTKSLFARVEGPDDQDPQGSVGRVTMIMSRDMVARLQEIADETPDSDYVTASVFLSPEEARSFIGTMSDLVDDFVKLHGNTSQ